jgi:hypothetical protein
VGAFLVALIGIGYLFGSFEGGLDFLIAIAASGAFAVLVELWLRRGERQDAAVEPGDFDERATKRAVRRGVVRTALTAIVWVVLALIGAGFLSSAWQTRGDRPEHFGDVVRHGFFVSHPGFRTTHSWGCCNTYFRSVSTMFTTEPKVASPLAQSVNLEFELDLRGRLDQDTLQDIPVTGVNVASQQTVVDRAALRDLPNGVVATAIAELRRPLDVASFYDLVERVGISEPDFGFGDLSVFLQPQRNGERMFGTYFDERVSWPSPAVAEFQAWVKTLRDSDDKVLDGLGLPPKRELERIAATPRIYGFVLDQATPEQLRRVATDPSVDRVSLGDVAYNLAAARGVED